MNNAYFHNVTSRVPLPPEWQGQGGWNVPFLTERGHTAYATCKIVILSRFVALSVSLVLKASLYCRWFGARQGAQGSARAGRADGGASEPAE